MHKTGFLEITMSELIKPIGIICDCAFMAKVAQKGFLNKNF